MIPSRVYKRNDKKVQFSDSLIKNEMQFQNRANFPTNLKTTVGAWGDFVLFSYILLYWNFKDTNIITSFVILTTFALT